MELESSKGNFRMIKKMKILLFQYAIYGDWSLILCRIIFCITYLVLLDLQEINIGCLSTFQEKLSEYMNCQALDDTFTSAYYPVSHVN